MTYKEKAVLECWKMLGDPTVFRLQTDHQAVAFWEAILDTSITLEQEIRNA